jgi:hypothetical protein
VWVNLLSLIQSHEVRDDWQIALNVGDWTDKSQMVKMVLKAFGRRNEDQPSFYY